MTLRYNWFDIPGNLEEFADKARKEGHERVDIRITPHINAFWLPILLWFGLGI